MAKTTNRAIPNIEFNFEFPETQAKRTGETKSGRLPEPNHNLYTMLTVVVYSLLFGKIYRPDFFTASSNGLIFS